MHPISPVNVDFLGSTTEPINSNCETCGSIPTGCELSSDPDKAARSLEILNEAETYMLNCVAMAQQTKADHLVVVLQLYKSGTALYFRQRQC